jgi:hypothetical protein
VAFENFIGPIVATPLDELRRPAPNQDEIDRVTTETLIRTAIAKETGPMKTEEVFPRKWLNGDDLPHDTTATIERVVMEELHNPATRKKERKPVAYFAGKRKALILNRTNWMTLSGLFGDESDTWAGRRIVLGAELVDSPQGRVRAVRVQDVIPETLATPPAEIPETDEEDDEIPVPGEPVLVPPPMTNGDGKKKTQVVTDFWKAIRDAGKTQEDGKRILELCHQDFEMALKSLQEEAPF